SLSFGPWSELTLFGKTLFELLDYLTSNLMMPVFGLVLTLLLGWRIGDAMLPADLSPILRFSLLWCWRIVAPLLICGILIRGIL
ncbi:MAG: sodium-dependent transporter, partial [Aeromonas sp.]